MVDITNTGDFHGSVAEALHTNHEHHGGADHHNDNDAPMTPKPHIVKHATYVGMALDSQSTRNRLEHLMGNTHYVDPLTRQRIESWLARARSNDNTPAGHWDITAS